MNREDLIQLFDKNKEDVAKYEKNKKRIKDILLSTILTQRFYQPEL